MYQFVDYYMHRADTFLITNFLIVLFTAFGIGMYYLNKDDKKSG